LLHATKTKGAREIPAALHASRNPENRMRVALNAAGNGVSAAFLFRGYNFNPIFYWIF
jgi:hypothetical protein